MSRYFDHPIDTVMIALTPEEAELLTAAKKAKPSIPISALRAEREWLGAQLECEKAIDHQNVYHSGAEKASELQLIRLKAEIDILSILIARYDPMRPTEDECRRRTPDCLQVRPEEWKGCCRGEDTTFTVLPQMWIPEEEGK